MAKSEGRELHREFVGMLFALAIGQVAADAAIVANSSVPTTDCLPSYFHLFLAATVIAASWVGWGQSDHSLSDITGVFTFDFLELAVDLWLVVLYFFLVMGTELPLNNATSIAASVESESKWLLVIFISYFVWDLVSKITPPKRKKNDETPENQCETAQSWFPRNDQGRLIVVQRGWASLACALLAWLAYWWLDAVKEDVPHILLADLALLSLVLLFRAFKLRNLNDVFSDGRAIALIAFFGILFFTFLAGATESTKIGNAVSQAISWLIHAIFGGDVAVAG